ncbi:PTS transporter subunit IIC [Fonticella tunisiensis]|uniref:PTS system galactitol-specific IIC component n=1 Tax=Fonticella tunisiensis TaxID=1096341 RepID=A0A4R7KTY8_9CLOT|nr:PTS transporter subunit IIC [Fonticella tunisiensis]TDT63607.1 PTS system galactitol-specific IIC component [Fonticella tunisiensis]
MFQQFMNTFGAAILLPVIILIFELCLGIKPTKALKSALYIGIGLNGLVKVLNPYFMGLIGKPVSDMITSTGINLPYVDTGWALLAAVGYSTIIGVLVIPVGIVVNLIMLFLKWTDTLDLDLWNFWHWAFVGSMVYYSTGSLLYGVLAAVAMEMFLLIVADITAPVMQKHFGLPGISFPHASGQGLVFILAPLKWFYDKVGLSNLHVSSKDIRRRFGILGDASVLGFIISFFIGLIAWHNQLNKMETWAGLLTIGIGTGTFIYLYPKATACLLEGFTTLSDKVRTLLTKSGIKRQINFGMDSALTVGHPDVITVGLLTMIVTVPLVFILPGNKFLMLADLGVTPFFLASVTVAVLGGNIITSFITTTIGIVIDLYFSTAIAPAFAQTVKAIGVKLPDTGKAVVGADIRPVHGLFYFLGKSSVGIAVVFAVIIVVLLVFKKHSKSFYKAFGYGEETGNNLSM